MSIYGYIEILAGTGLMMHNNLWGTIENELRHNSDQIADEIKAMIEVVTPILSGSLHSDFSTSTAETPGSVTLGPVDLAYIYAEGTEQQAYWNRIYVPYVEGGPLGLPTYTNDPRLIFLDTALGDGQAATEIWAKTFIDVAIAKWEIGMGVPGAMGNLQSIP